MPEASSFEILTDGMMGYIVSKQRVQVANLNPQGKKIKFENYYYKEGIRNVNY